MTKWRLAITAAVCGGLLAASLSAVQAGPNVVAEGVAPIERSGDAADPPLLLVYVIDDDGIPLKGAEVSLTYATGSKLKETTGGGGVALLRLRDGGSLTVRASFKGYAPSEARRVVVKGNGLTAIALPLQQ